MFIPCHVIQKLAFWFSNEKKWQTNNQITLLQEHTKIITHSQYAGTP